MTNTSSEGTGSEYELRFRSLCMQGRGYTFPCDASGHVDLDALSLSTLDTYLYARVLIGREFAYPEVHRRATTALPLEPAHGLADSSGVRSP